MQEPTVLSMYKQLVRCVKLMNCMCAFFRPQMAFYQDVCSEEY